MPKSLTVVRGDGSLSMYEIGKLSYLLILGALALVAAMAINDFMTKIIKCYIPKEDSLLGYFIYMLLAIGLVILVVYIGCMLAPDIIEYINLSPM